MRPLVRRCVTIPFRTFTREGAAAPLLNPFLKAWEIECLVATYRRLASRIDAGGYDCVFVFPCMFVNAPPLLRYARTPALFYAPEPWRKYYEAPEPRPYALEPRDLPRRLAYAPTSSRLRGIDRASMKAATRVLTDSEFTESCLRSVYGVSAEVAYLGVATDTFQPMDTDPGDFVLSVGSLTPKKGFAFLVESLALIPKGRRPLLRLVCNAVWPPERAYVERLAQKHCVDLHIHVDIPDADLARIYNAASLMLYAPIREPFGLAALEAMACGTPVVGVAEGGVKESVIHQETGLLTPRDPQQFAQAVEFLLDHPGVRRSYAKAARGHVCEHWTWGMAAGRVEDAIHRTVSEQDRCT